MDVTVDVDKVSVQEYEWDVLIFISVELKYQMYFSLCGNR